MQNGQDQIKAGTEVAYRFELSIEKEFTDEWLFEMQWLKLVDSFNIYYYY